MHLDVYSNDEFKAAKKFKCKQDKAQMYAESAYGLEAGFD